MKRHVLIYLFIASCMAPAVTRAQFNPTNNRFDPYNPVRVFTITSPNGKVLQIGGEGGQLLNDGTPTSMAPSYTGLARQQWYIYNDGLGTLKIVNRLTNFTLHQFTGSDGYPVTMTPIQYRSNALPEERWVIFPTVSNSWDAILSLYQNSYLGFFDYTSSGNTANAYRYRGDGSFQPRRWKVTDVSTSSSPANTIGVYTFSNANSGKLLEIGGVSEAVSAKTQQWDNVNLASQQWYIANATGGYYNIINRNTGLALEIGPDANAIQTAGTIAQQNTFTNADNQQWALDWNSSTSNFSIRNKASGYVLEVGASRTDNGAPVNQWYDFKQSKQQWQLNYIGSF